jgi:plasmid stabilization system protein ParE
MDYEVVWSEPAAEQLEEIIRYIANDNASAAEKVRIEIMDHVELLARLPFIGPVYEADRKGRTREILCRKYRIFYRVDEAARRVDILTVWHGARLDPILPD